MAEDLADRWARGVHDQARRYCVAMSRFLGCSVEACLDGPGAAWQAGVDAVGAEGYRRAMREFIGEST